MKRKGLLAAVLACLTLFAAVCGAFCGCDGGDPTETADNSALYGAPVEFEGEPHSLSVFFVNVGKADCAAVLIDGRCWLIDVGTEESFPAIYAALTELEVNEIEGVILTHEHSDHIGGLEAVSARCEIGRVYCPEFLITRAEIDAVVYDESLTLQTVKAGDSIEAAPGAAFEVLAPSHLLEGDGNDNSMVLKLTVNGRSFLFTGDMQTAEDRELVASGADLSCDVLKVPNHGNPDSTSAEFAEAASPLISVISTDTSVDHHSANARVRARLSSSEIYITQNYSMGVLVNVSEKGEISLSFPEKPQAASGAELVLASKANQTFVVRPTGGEVDLTGWFVYSTKGYEVFNFPAGTKLSSDLLVACRKSAQVSEADLVWDKKKVWADTKADNAVLCDPYGNEVSRIESN